MRPLRQRNRSRELSALLGPTDGGFFNVYEAQEARQGGTTWRGWVPDDDPRYTGGWNFLFGKNLNPHFVQRSREQDQTSSPQDETPQRRPPRHR
jgi:hypothetical protein